MYGTEIIEILDSYLAGEITDMGLNLALTEFWRAVANGEFSDKNWGFPYKLPDFQEMRAF